MPLFGPNTRRVDLRHFKLTTTLIFYHASRNYFDDIDATASAAVAALDQLPAGTNERALVLDIDETSLLNDWPSLIRPGAGGVVGDRPFLYDENRWNEWIEQSRSRGCEGTLSIYRRAVELGLKVFFITGRPESQRAPTELNLRRVGFEAWCEVIMRGQVGDNHAQTAQEYKTEARQRITQQGFEIVMNIGDQESDLRGPNSGKVFKYPNPFYFVA